MNKNTLLTLAVVACCGVLHAQNSFGVLVNTGVTFTSRGGNAVGNTSPSTQWTRYNPSAYAGWGVDPAFPGTRSFTGLHFFIQDQDLSTVDPFSIVAYTESTATPGLPDTTAPLGTTGTFALPTGTGAGAYQVTANFTTAIHAPSAASVFVGISQSTGWNATTTDGCSIWATSSAGTVAVCDKPGASAPTVAPLNSFSGFFVPSTPTTAYSSTRMFHIEPITTTAAGTATALHYSDTLHPAANTAPGTGCMFSSQFPDANNPPLNALRADDLGFRYLKTGLADGSPVFFLADLSSTFGPELPVSVFLAGSTGVACLNLASMITLNLSVTTTGVSTNLISFGGATARLGLLGIPILQQAAALDVAANVVHASPCQKSTL